MGNASHLRGGSESSDQGALEDSLKRLSPPSQRVHFTASIALVTKVTIHARWYSLSPWPSFPHLPDLST